ncbi:hypothetical protein Hdeb2414_s0008g00266871 [Helianthus debilis subsp. tardiflorus]
MPIREALRTSVLSKKWRYTWRGMPKLVFTDNMVTLPSIRSYRLLKKYRAGRVGGEDHRPGPNIWRGTFFS